MISSAVHFMNATRWIAFLLVFSGCCQHESDEVKTLKIKNACLVSNYFIVVSTLKAERDRAFVEGYIEGKIAMNDYIWSLVITN